MCHWKRKVQHSCAKVLNDISHVFPFFMLGSPGSSDHEQRTQSAASSRRLRTGRPVDKSAKMTWGLIANVATIAGRICHIHLLRVPFNTTVPSSMPYFLMTLRSWSMSNSSVASLPGDMSRKPKTDRKPKAEKLTNTIPNACKHHDALLSTGVLTLRTLLNGSMWKQNNSCKNTWRIIQNH